MSYTEYQDQSTSEDALAQLGRLAEDLAQADAEVAEIEAKLQEAREKQRDLSEFRIPQLMDDIGIADFTTSSGFKVSVKETIRASIPAARRGEATEWLDEHGHAALVKRAFTIEFDKEEEEKARQFAEELRQREDRLRVAEDFKVHPSTLSAWAKEQLAEGVDIPLDLFGVYRQRVAKIK